MRKNNAFFSPSLCPSVFHVLPWKLKMLCPVQFTFYSVAAATAATTTTTTIIITIIAKLFFV
jgi:hypothetical protein